MLDNALIELIVTVLTNGETAAGIAGTPIAQSFQPQQQGVNSEPTVYLNKLFDHRYGTLTRDDEYDDMNSVMVHTETQQYETHFQISATATQNPATPAQYTASDICNLCAAILQSSAALATFQNNMVGIERITDIRNPKIQNDRNQFEATPSFDFVVTHKQVLVTDIPILSGTTFAVYEI